MEGTAKRSATGLEPLGMVEIMGVRFVYPPNPNYKLWRIG